MRWIAVVGIAWACGVFAPAASAARTGHTPIDVYLDGELAKYHSRMFGCDITAGVVLDGRPMIAERFLWDVLDVSADTHLLKRWGVFQLGGLDFKVGSRLVIREVPTLGGGGWAEKVMPAAPTILRDGPHDRLYLPAHPILGMLGHAMEWRPAQNALYIRAGAGKPPPGYSLY